MNELIGQPGELTFTVEVTRKDTGKVDKYELIGKILGDNEDGGNTLDSSTERGDGCSDGTIGGIGSP